METIEQAFRALADRTRLRILNLLRDGDICVGDLVQLLGTPQPTASRHLAYLRRTGLVTVKRDGLWAFYSLLVPSSKFQRSLLRCLDACRSDMPELRKDTRKAAELRKSGSCCPKLPQASLSQSCRRAGASKKVKLQ